jgi:hypothetical protein
MLAGVAYCVRVIGAEILLPKANRSQQGEEQLANFLEKRAQFLADSSYSPISEILSLLAYGKRIALADGSTANAMWLEDRNTYFLNGQPIEVDSFKRMAQEVVGDAERQLWEKLLWTKELSSRFQINLQAIKDDLHMSERRKSFVQDPRNCLDKKIQWMFD